MDLTDDTAFLQAVAPFAAYQIEQSREEKYWQLEPDNLSDETWRGKSRLKEGKWRKYSRKHVVKNLNKNPMKADMAMKIILITLAIK